MGKTLDILEADRLSLLNRIVDEIAAERGEDLSDELMPNYREVLLIEAESAYEAWMARIEDGAAIGALEPLDGLFVALFEIDEAIAEIMATGRKPGETLQ